MAARLLLFIKFGSLVDYEESISAGNFFLRVHIKLICLLGVHTAHIKNIKSWQSNQTEKRSIKFWFPIMKTVSKNRSGLWFYFFLCLMVPPSSCWPPYQASRKRHLDSARSSKKTQHPEVRKSFFFFFEIHNTFPRSAPSSRFSLLNHWPIDNQIICKENMVITSLDQRGFSPDAEDATSFS